MLFSRLRGRKLTVPLWFFLASASVTWVALGHSQPLHTPPVVSTGKLPAPELVKQLVQETYLKFKDNTGGANADYIPALAKVPKDLFGIAVVGSTGSVYTAGDVDYEFSIQSAGKPFVFALVCQAIGVEEARKKIGVNATGMRFNSIVALETNAARTMNPMVNPGAISSVSLVPGATADEKWETIRKGLSDFAGRELKLNDEVYKSEAATNQRNRAIGQLLLAYERIYFKPVPTVDVYTKMCALNVSAKDLAVMSATLANGGVNPITGKKVIDPDVCPHVLAAMATAGLYDTSGDWLYDIGMPGKSGVGGGIICVAPGKGGLGTFAPPLDEAGNSVKGQLVAKELAQKLGLNLFSSGVAEKK
jgi:glutaminase